MAGGLPSGVLLVAKPAGVTSHDVVERVRGLPIAHGAKVGHAGEEKACEATRIM